LTEACGSLFPATATIGGDGAGLQVLIDSNTGQIQGDIELDSCVPLVVNYDLAVTDACDDIPDPTILSVSPPSGSLFPVGSTPVVVTAIDSESNESTHTFNVIITANDTVAPIISGVANGSTTLECGTALPDPLFVTATDDCDPNPTLTFNETIVAGDCPVISVVTRTWTATDAAGNTSSVTHVYTIIDTTAPVITTTAVDILPSDAPITFTVTATDACSVADLVLTYDCTAVNGAGKTISKLESCVVEIVGNEVTILDSGGVGTTITILANATDACGNSSSADITVTVLRPANEGVGNGVDGNTPGHDNNGGNDDPEFEPGNPGAKGKNK
jgi:hypothetical protein